MVAPVKSGNAYRGHGGGGGGRPYGLMLLVALGAAILGVTVLHKLREGRLFSLLVKEKDRELFSLHLLLQREHEFSKEAQKKLQEMKTNLYTIKAQKLEVEGRLLEVQSLVSSLKDEQKIIESQLEEKRSEIKMLRQQQMMSSGEIREEASIQKEGEIDDSKSHSGKPVSVWSVSSDDPSNPAVNLQNEGMDRSKNETDTLSKQEQRKLEDTSGEGGSEQRMRTGSDSSDSGMRVRNGKQRKLRRKKWRDLIRRSGQERNGNSELAAKKSNQTESYNSTSRNQDDVNKGQERPIDNEEQGKQDEHVTLRKRQIAEPEQDSSLNDNAEMKERQIAEPEQDSSFNDNAEMKERQIAEPEQDSSLNDNAEMKEPQIAEPDPDSSAGKVEVNSIPEEDSKEIDRGSDHVEAEEEANSFKDDEFEHETN